MENRISRSPGTMGVRRMPDDLDSGYCHLRDNRPGVVRINLDGIWVVLCAEHLTNLRRMLDKPEPAPPIEPATPYPHP